MGIVFDIFGLVAGLLGVVGLVQPCLAPPAPMKTQVQIQVGLESPPYTPPAPGYSAPDTPSGDLPDVRTWDEVGDFMNIVVDPGWINAGGTSVITLDQSDSRQAAYTLLSANGDSICMAYVTITWADGSQYGWVGDFATMCGHPWYYSWIHLYNNYSPNCVWIDYVGGDSPPETPISGISLHWPDFKTLASIGNDVPSDVSQEMFCDDETKLQFHTEVDPNSITLPAQTFRRSGAGTSPKKVRKEPVRKRSTASTGAHGTNAPRVSRHHSKLVVSNSTEHSAQFLCDHPSSHGPHFAHEHERKFCRMSDKKVFPFCDDADQDNCFSWESKFLIAEGLTSLNFTEHTTEDWRGKKLKGT